MHAHDIAGDRQHLGTTQRHLGAAPSHPGAVRNERGQVVVIFALVLIFALIPMVGLVLDGGSAFAMRRTEQSAADLASLAGANDYLINRDSTSAIARARLVAGQNGFVHGAGGVTVDVSLTTTAGVKVTVDISAPHRNNFAAVVGMPTWEVSTTATAQASDTPDTAYGAAPIIFNIDAFDSNGKAKGPYADPGAPYSFGEGNGDVPDSPGDIAWTNYATGNLNSNDTRNIIGGTLVINKTLAYGEYIGQHNNGNHTTLYDSNGTCAAKPSIQACYAGKDVVVPIVDDAGNFQGWATFHVVSASGGSSKTVTGYFISSFDNAQLGTNCPIGGCPRYFGSYSIRLTN